MDVSIADYYDAHAMYVAAVRKLNMPMPTFADFIIGELQIALDYCGIKETTSLPDECAARFQLCLSPHCYALLKAWAVNHPVQKVEG